jgi:hypothetical protein
MPTYTATVDSGIDGQFTGLTAALGLFVADPQTGQNAIHLLIRSVSFTGPSAMTEWTLSRVDPSDGTHFDLICGTGVKMAAGGPAGFDILPTNDIGKQTAVGKQGQPWGYAFKTDGMVGTGKLRIDWDWVLTEG